MRKTKTWRWAVVLGATLIIGLLTWLVVGQLVKREIAFWGLLLTLLVMVAATFADWFTRDGKGKSKTWRERINNPNWIARVGMSAFFGLGAGLFVQQFIEPTEFDFLRAILARIEVQQAEANRKLDVVVQQTAPRPWRAIEEIDGYWGEARHGCRVVYRFERRDNALTVTLVRKEVGMTDYRMVASIIPDGRDDVLNAILRTSTAEDEKEGQALVFTYSDEASVQRLSWLNETRGEPTKLESCEIAQ